MKRRYATIFLSSIAIVAIVAAVGYFSINQLKVDGLTELKHADICVGDAIIIHSKPDITILDEGYGDVLVTVSGYLNPKVVAYSNVHWAVCYHHTMYSDVFFIVYAWND